MAATDPLMTLGELADWTRREIPQEEPFAKLVIQATSGLIRLHGDSNWTYSTLPPEARTIMALVTKNYYLNPEGIIAETTGPLSERKLEDFVRNMTLTDEEKITLARVAGKEPHLPLAGGRLWTVSTRREDVRCQPLDLYLRDSHGSDWMIPWVSLGENLYWDKHPGDVVGYGDGGGKYRYPVRGH